MRKEDIILEAYDLIKGEVMDEYGDASFLQGVVRMSEACISMVEKENEIYDVDCGN